MNRLKYEYTEPGYCRVVYSFENSEGQKAYYCAQEERKGLVVFYRCTDDWHEPAYEVKPKDAPELSPNSTEVDKAVNEWIENKWGVATCQ